ncbi:MAG: hypothetical protein QNJ60_06770 [Xenococcaceae cyanobacterium MO_188.B19]|nr:hypothetical protein [Xenococcaceae cyanobacterium MO_188.B19]
MVIGQVVLSWSCRRRQQLRWSTKLLYTALTPARTQVLIPN